MGAVRISNASREESMPALISFYLRFISPFICTDCRRGGARRAELSASLRDSAAGAGRGEEDRA